MNPVELKNLNKTLRHIREIDYKDLCYPIDPETNNRFVLGRGGQGTVEKVIFMGREFAAKRIGQLSGQLSTRLTNPSAGSCGDVSFTGGDYFAQLGKFCFFR